MAAKSNLRRNCGVLLEKQPVAQLLKNFPAFYGTRTFTTIFKRALHGPYP
jgi:hypothetical protein